MNAKRILITGALGTKIDIKALHWLVESVTEMRPDEIVCVDTSTEMLDALRAAYGGPIGVHAGTFEADHRVTALPEFYDVAPGWISTHGHRGQISLSRIGGNTALGAARKFGKSVVMGHTHRLGIISESRGYAGKITQLVTGMEVGNLMDMKQAQYLKGGTANWQQGFGVLTVDDCGEVTPSLVQFKRRGATVSARSVCAATSPGDRYRG